MKIFPEMILPDITITKENEFMPHETMLVELLKLDKEGIINSNIIIYTIENGRQELTPHEYRDYVGAYRLDKLHREDGPAMENIACRSWLREGRYHREDGPTIEMFNGYKEWHIEGQMLGRDDYDKLIQEIKDMPLVLRLVDPRKWVREFK